MKRLLPFALALALTTAACDTTQPSIHEAEPVVEAYLVAGEPFGQVRLTQTTDLEGVYDIASLGLAGAMVRVHELGPDGTIVRTIGYAANSDTVGIYRATGDERVRASTRYRLDVRLSDGGTVTGETFVPGTFDFTSQSDLEKVYQGADQFEVNVTASAYPGRQGIYVVSIRPLDPHPRNLTPFYLDAIYGIKAGEAYDPDTLDVTEIEDLYEASSPPVNESSWEPEADGTIRIRLPWFAVAFYGPVQVEFNAIDDNLFDFFRYFTAQQGGSTLSPGELPNILDSLEGGTGVFGSMARRSINIRILRGDG